MNLFGKYFDDNEKVLKSLTKIYGVGRSTALELGMTFGIGYNNKVKDLSKDVWSRLIQAIELGPKNYTSTVRLASKDLLWRDTNTKVFSGNQPIKSNLAFGQVLKGRSVLNKKLHQSLCENRALSKIRENIDLAKKIKSYKGLRHIEGLPCRGQRTHTNAITARKKRA
jgi:ribosomal protein S13